MSKSCCFFGHRNFMKTDSIENALFKNIESLIIKENISNFLFGSKSKFDDLCYEVVSELKEKYPHIQRIYVRAEYPCLSDIITKVIFWKAMKIHISSKSRLMQEKHLMWNEIKK